MTEKERLRAAWQKVAGDTTAVPQWGKAAEKLRGLREYKKAITVFATPAESLHQARINCLADGKNLLMPSPGIREGFFLVSARSVPFRDLSVAATYKGLEKYAKLLKNDAMAELTVDQLLCDSLAVDNHGVRLGDGKGFFDLCCALMKELGCLERDWCAFTFILEEQISQLPLPRDPWDVKMTGAVTPARTIYFEPEPRRPAIFWETLPPSRIRKIDPLWKLHEAKDTSHK